MNIENSFNRRLKRRVIPVLCVFLFLFGQSNLTAQSTPELQTALMKLGKLWVGVTAHGGKGSFEYRAGFFPNDFGIMAQRGQYQEAYSAAGITFATTNWYNPDELVDSVQRVSIYRLVNDYAPTGKVTVPMINYLRYRYPEQLVNFEEVELEDFGEYNPDYAGFKNHTYDQIVEVTNEHIFGSYRKEGEGEGIKVNRKLLSWSQQFHDNYIVSDITITNESDSTWKDFYISIQENMYNVYFSNGLNPAPPSNEAINYAMTWQHYYGGREGEDDLRVFYEYSADDPRAPGDDMGAPVTSQSGRLLYPNMSFYTILHASKEPYVNDADDVDDFNQPRITYTGKATQIPYNEENDDYGSNNFYAMRGEYSKDYPMSGNVREGTFHGLNTDELGVSDYSDYVAGYYTGAHEKTAVFGPYTFEPGQKLRFVWASGFAGIGFEKGKEVGEKWLAGTLENPPDMPDAETGWLPSNFEFPSDADEMDKRKDRWVSMGIDSVMESAARAKWNFEHDYNVPQAPPPPDYIEITGLGTGVEIVWSDPAAEAMDNFEGYRIMRKVSSADTVSYIEIYNSDATDIASEHTFVDDNVLFGAQYYYYLQAKARIDENDPDAYPSSRGKIIYSSRALDPNYEYVNPPRTSQNDLSKIRIAPNPYNINDPLLQTYGFTDQRGIIFFNLPGTVDIKIFTENGDLIQTIEHDSPVLAGSYTWDLLTSSQQIISSGIYIAVFQTPDGRVSYQKFIVVR